MKFLVTLLLCLLLDPITFGQDTPIVSKDILGRPSVSPIIQTTPNTEMSPEEALVRTAYAKFSYAAQQDVIGNLAMEAVYESDGTKHAGQPDKPELSSDQRLAAAQVIFTLSNFKIGNLADIVSSKAVDLISPPIGEVLTASTPNYGFGTKGHPMVWVALQPRWEPATAPAPEMMTRTLGELDAVKFKARLPSDPETEWKRYASYSVTVDFQGKTRGPYKALFIFGQDAKGSAMVMPDDATTDSILLADMLAVHLFPEMLVNSPMREYPVVSSWLSANQKSGPACSVGKGDVCCDLVQLQCGPGSADVAEYMMKPLPSRSPKK